MFYDKDTLIKWGQQASFDFFTLDKPLTDSIVKIACDNNLNQEQIKRICEIANKETMIQIYKSASDHTQEFDLADYCCVLEKLSEYQKQPEPISSDYLSPPPSQIISTIKLSHELSHDSKIKDRNDFFRLKKEANRLRIKEVQAKDKLKVNILKYADLKEDLAKAIKSALNEGYKIEDLFAAVKSAMPMDSNKAIKYIKDALDSIKSKGGFLSRVWSGIKGLFKGAESVDPELISKLLQKNNGKVKLRIINGEHKLFKALRAVYDSEKSMLDSDRLARDINRKLKVVEKELHSKRPKEGEWF